MHTRGRCRARGTLLPMQRTGRSSRAAAVQAQAPLLGVAGAGAAAATRCCLPLHHPLLAEARAPAAGQRFGHSAPSNLQHTAPAHRARRSACSSLPERSRGHGDRAEVACSRPASEQQEPHATCGLGCAGKAPADRSRCALAVQLAITKALPSHKHSKQQLSRRAVTRCLDSCRGAASAARGGTRASEAPLVSGRASCRPRPVPRICAASSGHQWRARALLHASSRRRC